MATLIYAPESFIIAVLFGLVNYFMIKLLKTKSIAKAYAEFSTKYIQQYAIVFVVSYLLRTIILSMMGVYKVIIKDSYNRLIIYLVVTTCMETPNLFYIYMTHYKDFYVVRIREVNLE